MREKKENSGKKVGKKKWKLNTQTRPLIQNLNDQKGMKFD